MENIYEFGQGGFWCQWVDIDNLFQKIQVLKRFKSTVDAGAGQSEIPA
jgi:hypothetical protein